MENVFVYGTLQNSTQRFWILKHRVDAEDDRLEDYSKVMHSYLITYPTIKKDKGKFVAGVVFKAEPWDIERMDRYETANYEKIKVKLASGKEALAYIEASYENA